jgi:hypothetical protein
MEADEQRGHGEETPIDTAQVFPAHEQPAEIAEPNKAAFYSVAAR